MGTSSVLALVESIAKDQGKPMPSHVGFNPATCSKADCDLLASTMFQLGRRSEMLHLYRQLGKMLAAMQAGIDMVQGAGLTTDKHIVSNTDRVQAVA
jgi:hypothetical protein